MASSESLYQGFLNALNTGDISGYLNRMNEIVQAARAAYDELDRLGTLKTIQAPEIARQEAENNRMRTMLMTGRYIAPANGPAAPGMKTGDLLSPEQIRNIERHLQGGMQKIISLTQREVKQTGVAINKYYDSLAKQNGMTMDEFRKGTSNWAEFSKRMSDYQKYLDFEQKHTSSVTMQSSAGAYTQQVRDNVANPYEYARKWGVFRVDKMGQNSYNDLVNLIKQQQQQASQMYSTMGQTYRTINRAEGITVKGLLNGGSGSSSGSNTTEETLEQINANILEQWEDAIRKMSINTNSLKAPEPSGPSEAWQAYTQSQKEPTDELKNLTDALDALNKKEGVTPTGSRQKDGKDTAWFGEISKEFSQITGSVSGIFSGIEQLGIELPQGLKDVLGGIQAVAGILTAISSLITIITAIQSAKAVPVIGTFLAGGGVIRAAGGTLVGNSYSGDNLRAIGADGQLYGLNAGEVVLNRAQTNAVASQLTDGGGGGTTKVVGVLKGEDIVLMADRYGLRRGLGELVFGKNL